jgi:hypothetical protein
MRSVGVRIREHLDFWSRTEKQHDVLAVPS